MRSSGLVELSLLFTLSYAISVPSTHVRSRQAPGSYFPITGATGGVYPRLEIRDLEQTGTMWNLYLLAMTEFQATNQDDIASWYQIAGIHGMPWIPWDGVQGNADDSRGVFQKGYCPHNNLLFGTWHRPYLALFEQELQKHALSIANQFPNATRSTYQDAAKKLRTPFWDWAKALPTSEPVLPTALTVEKVNVTFPNGTAAEIDNPLFDYNFHPLDHSQINGTGCPLTPTQNGPVGGLPYVCDNDLMTVRDGQNISDHADLNAKLRNILPSQRSKLFTILSQWQPFNAFSNAAACGSDHRIGTLEDVHNPIHTLNWPGHMSPASVSAFDPMFWMHHANVDRQLALYQAVFPETYVDTCIADTPTYTINTGDTLDANSPLTPFHINAAGDFWTSANSRNITSMGYTYPELANNPSNATLVASIKAQYSGPSDASASSTRELRRRSISQANATTPSNRTIYLAQITIPQYGLDDGAGGGSPYDLLVFLGNISANSTSWLDSTAFVGLASTLGGLSMKSNQTSTALIDLSDAIAKNLGNVTDTSKVSDYLKGNLKWRLGIGRYAIAKDSVNGAKVELVSTQVQVASEESTFDRWVGGFVSYGIVDA